MKGYFEAFFEQPPPFKLSLVETDSEETVWSATIREGTSVFPLHVFFLIYFHYEMVMLLISCSPLRRLCG